MHGVVIQWFVLDVLVLVAFAIVLFAARRLRKGQAGPLLPALVMLGAIGAIGDLVFTVRDGWLAIAGTSAHVVAMQTGLNRGHDFVRGTVDGTTVSVSLSCPHARRIEIQQGIDKNVSAGGGAPAMFDIFWVPEQPWTAELVGEAEGFELVRVGLSWRRGRSRCTR